MQKTNHKPIENPTKCEELWNSQETLPFVDYLVSIMNFVHFSIVSFSCCKIYQTELKPKFLARFIS